MALRHRVLPCLAALSFGMAAQAGPWAEVGDAQTRSDVELAAAYGLINNVTMQWPMPWTGILGNLQDGRQADALPPEVQEAAERLLVKGRDDLHIGRARAEIAVDFTNDPATVRGYDALGRSKVQGQTAYEYVSSDTAVRVAVGGQKSTRHETQALVLDSSYIAHRFDDAIVYAGYVSHWWGPGWISALSLSNNARPMPQVGVSRVQTDPSHWWLLSWMGPWQAEAFVGLLDGPREARDTGYIGVRVAMNPLPGLEVGLSRTTEMCGSGHPCSPLVDYFTFSNDDQSVNKTNEQGSIDLRYTNTAFSHAYAIYAQFMNEDTNPIIHSSTSRLLGGTVWLTLWDLPTRLTFEYSNSLGTQNLWWGPIQHGVAYNNGQYLDGMRYRDRSLGFSLDSDSVLYSLQASAIDPGLRTWTLTFHRALVSHPLNNWGNVVTDSAVRFNAAELRVSTPLRWGEYAARVETSGRWQSDQPRPARGSGLSFEVALRFGL